MKPFLIITITLISLCNATAQADTAYINFLYKEIRTHQPYGTIYYSELPHKEIAQIKFNNLNKKIFKSFDKHIPDSVLILTPEEQQFILAALKKAVATPLPDHMFDNSKSTKPDSLVPTIDRVNKLVYDSLRNIADSTLRLNFRKNSILHWAFAFTNPIYIRNKTIFLNYYMYYRNSSGEHALMFYKKRNNKWERWIAIGGGAW